MSADAIHELHQRGLSLLFERGLELALRVQEDAMAAESAEARARLAVAFHRISRSVRQTAALQMRMVRESEAAARLARGEARDDATRRRETRKARIRAEIVRSLWTEHEGEPPDDVTGELDERLEVEADRDGFLDEPPDILIARLCEELDLPPPLAGEGGPRSGSDEGSRSGAARPPAGDTSGDDLAFDAAPPNSS